MIPLRIVEDGLRICSTSARAKVELMHESAARELLGQLRSRLATCPEFQREHVQADLDRIIGALETFHPRPATIAAARAELSRSHPDHGGDAVAFGKALKKFRKLKGAA